LRNETVESVLGIVKETMGFRRFSMSERNTGQFGASRTLAAQSSAHRTRAIAALCEELDQTRTNSPGSRLRLHYAIRMSPCTHIRRMPRAKSNGCNTGGLEWDLLPVDFLRQIR
jgi:hypothetical protein